MVLRKIFGSERKEVARGCRNLNKEELHNFFSSTNLRVINRGG
jgi:hypothetical protein